MTEQNCKKEGLQPHLLQRYRIIRRRSLSLVQDLSVEDCQLQAMADVSPSKWHLAHTSWFFDTFLLAVHLPNYAPFNEAFSVLFNSYYNGIGEQFTRAKRGCLSRPTLDEVFEYRRFVDEAMEQLFAVALNEDILSTIELGLNHEQQHQELMLMDIKYNFSVNPLFPEYKKAHKAHINESNPPEQLNPISYTHFEQSIMNIGTDANDGFAYDNEQPKHQVLIHPFSFANRLVSNEEYLAFIEAKGYGKPEYWLSDGWSYIKTHNISKPLYWHNVDGKWFEFTLVGLKELDLQAPVTHVSYFEAVAYANFVNARLPTEFEWEYAAKQSKSEDSDVQLVAKSCTNEQRITQLGDTCWQWTNSAYLPYPGFRPIEGAAGEYNGKFMSNQMVLRGGCLYTPADHTRNTYRNFYYPHQAWMCSGIRLARDVM